MNHNLRRYPVTIRQVKDRDAFSGVSYVASCKELGVIGAGDDPHQALVICYEMCAEALRDGHAGAVPPALLKAARTVAKAAALRGAAWTGLTIPHLLWIGNQHPKLWKEKMEDEFMPALERTAAVAHQREQIRLRGKKA